MLCEPQSIKGSGIATVNFQWISRTKSGSHPRNLWKTRIKPIIGVEPLTYLTP
jgi:hypothetical protein